MTPRSYHRGSTRLAVAPRTEFAHLPVFPPSQALPSPFVGRENEQEQGLRLLADRRVVAITGPSGSGKTALATAISLDSGLTSFWVELAPQLNDTIEPLLWQLARPLAQLAPESWHLLHQIQQAGWGYPPIVRLQIILDAYARQPTETLLCLDRLEYIAEPAIEALIAGLSDYVAKTHYTQLKLLLVGTTLPYRVAPYTMQSLGGLMPEALERWAHELSLSLSRAEIEQIHTQTDGLPQAVRLLFEALRDKPGDTLARAAVTQTEVRRFAWWLLAGLTADERAALERLALRPEPFTTLPRQLQERLLMLEGRHLAMIVGDQVIVHPLIYSFHQQYRSGR
jgi:ATP/maltotriose-dependent transcriptional regulator MalT